MNAEVTPVSRGERVIRVCKDIPATETTGRGALLPSGRRIYLMEVLGCFVKSMGERVWGTAL